MPGSQPIICLPDATGAAWLYPASLPKTWHAPNLISSFLFLPLCNPLTTLLCFSAHSSCMFYVSGFTNPCQLYDTRHSARRRFSKGFQFTCVKRAWDAYINLKVNIIISFCIILFVVTYWSLFFLSFFHVSFCTEQLQFLQHQMQQQQQMAMGAAAPQGGVPRHHTASQPRSKRKRSTPQPLPKSWKT